MSDVRMGVIGCGSMANHHMDYLNEIEGCTFVAAADNDKQAVSAAVEKHGIKGFDDGFALINSGEVDAVLIATPHYFHPPYGMAAFEKGIHVLTEKPVAVTAKAAQEINEAHKKHPKVVYAAMFQQRTRRDWQKVKQMVESGQLGELMRVNWTVTSWFRTQTYYDSGGWRATWEGEGGGVLINQCPHNLDLFQWFVGMPDKVWALAGLGKYHHIEVEDEIVAMMTFANGAVGTFITSTGEAPGINRLEIVGDKGTLITEGGTITFLENEPAAKDFCQNSPERFKRPDVHRHEIKIGGEGGKHREVTENFISAIRNGTPVIAPAEEGIHGLELGNAMLMAGITGQPVDVPTDREAFDQLMKDLAKNSTFQKKEAKTSVASMSGSF